MKADKIREWTVDELRAKEHEFAERLFRLRFQLAGGQTDAVQKIRVLRKDIARVKTILGEMAARAAAEKKS